MGDFFSLDAATRTVITGALDDVLTEFSKPCRLVYPPLWQSCANCVFDPVGKKSANRWKHGGPIPFSAGSICSVCSGAGGHHAAEETEEVMVKIEWEPKRFWVPFPGVDLRAPYSVCQMKCFAHVVAKLMRAEYVVVQTPIEPILRTKMKMVGAPVSPGNIIQNRYFIATYESRG